MARTARELGLPALPGLLAGGGGALDVLEEGAVAKLPVLWVDGGSAAIISLAGALSDKDVWAVGLAAQGPSLANKTLVEHWDGDSWTIEPSPNQTPQGDNVNALFAVATASPGNVMAVGVWDSLEFGNPGFRTLALLTTQG